MELVTGSQFTPWPLIWKCVHPSSDQLRYSTGLGLSQRSCYSNCMTQISAFTSALTGFYVSLLHGVGNSPLTHKTPWALKSCCRCCCLCEQISLDKSCCQMTWEYIHRLQRKCKSESKYLERGGDLNRHLTTDFSSHFLTSLHFSPSKR